MNALSVGDWLKRRRRSLDLTQAELADQVGCSVETIRRLEAETLRPSKALAERLAEYLDILPEQRPQFVRFARGQADADQFVVSTPTAGATASALAARPSPPSAESQHIRFCTSPDGVRIAYGTVGDGPVLVKAANWLSHLEYDWNSPVWQHWLTGLSQHLTFVRYDERGCGLLDWNVTDFSLEAWVQDLELVVDALGLARFPLLGVSQGVHDSVHA